MTDKETDALRTLTRRWIAQANHPQRSRQPEVRDAILKCATDLQALLNPAG